MRAAVQAIEDDRIEVHQLKPALDLMDQTCSDLASRVTQLLDQRDNAAAPANQEHATIAALVEKIDRAHASEIKDTGMTVHLQGDRTITTEHASAVERILHGLIGNALRYGPKATAINVSFFRYGATIEVHVSDRGAGIDRRYRHALFRGAIRMPHHSEHNSGQGLYLASEQAASLGGRLSYYFIPPDISTFRLVLPTKA